MVDDTLPGRHVEIPFAPAARARLELRGGVPPAVVRATSPDAYRDTPLLAAVSFAGRPSPVRAHGSSVEIDFNRTWFEALRGVTSHTTVELSPRVPWSIEARGGVEHATFELEDLVLADFELRGGMRDVNLRLGRPDGTARVVIRGGACDLAIERPRDVPCALELKGGGVGLGLDELTLGAIGRLAWKDPAFDDARDRYVIEVRGGAVGLSIRKRAPRVRADAPPPIEPVPPAAEARDG